MTPAPERDERLGSFGLGVAGVAFAVAIFGSVVLTGTAVVIFGAPKGNPTLAITAAGTMGLWLGFAGVPLLVARRRGGPVELLGLRTCPLIDVPLGVGVGLASTYVAGFVSNLTLDRSHTKELERKAGEVIDRAQHPAAVVFLVVLLCVATPLVEELYFRGIVFRSLARIVPVPVAAAIGGAVFGLVHFSGGSPSVVASQLGLLAAFGVALCVLTWRTGRLGAAVVAHATFNLITVIAQLAQR